MQKKIVNTKFENAAFTKISERSKINFIAEQTETAVSRIMSNIRYRRELSEWVRNNLTKKYDGMPGFTHGIKLIPSLFAKYGIVYAAKLGPPPSHSKELIANSSMLLIVGYTRDDRLSYFNVGRVFANVAVKATRYGYATSALAASVIEPRTRDAVIKESKISFKPVIVLRFGKTEAKGRHSPRWPVSSLVN